MRKSLGIIFITGAVIYYFFLDSGEMNNEPENKNEIEEVLEIQELSSIPKIEVKFKRVIENKVVKGVTVEKKAGERIEFIEEKLKELFSDITFEYVDNSSGDASFLEEFLIKELEYQVSIVEVFEDSRLINYEKKTNGRFCGITILFGSNEIESIGLKSCDRGFFTLVFQDNLVDSFQSDSSLDLKENYLKLFDEGIRKRIDLEIIKDKKKVESFINSLCLRFKHPKTCQALKSIQSLAFPF